MQQLKERIEQLRAKNEREGCSVFTIRIFCEEALELIDTAPAERPIEAKVEAKEFSATVQPGRSANRQAT